MHIHSLQVFLHVLSLQGVIQEVHHGNFFPVNLNIGPPVIALSSASACVLVTLWRGNTRNSAVASTILDSPDHHHMYTCRSIQR